MYYPPEFEILEKYYSMNPQEFNNQVLNSKLKYSRNTNVMDLYIVLPIVKLFVDEDSVSIWEDASIFPENEVFDFLRTNDNYLKMW
jgi:hypothetical protein